MLISLVLSLEPHKVPQVMPGVPLGVFVGVEKHHKPKIQLFHVSHFKSL